VFKNFIYILHIAREIIIQRGTTKKQVVLSVAKPFPENSTNCSFI